jgi:hypothetical protein
MEFLYNAILKITSLLRASELISGDACFARRKSMLYLRHGIIFRHGYLNALLTYPIPLTRSIHMMRPAIEATVKVTHVWSPFDFRSLKEPQL